MFPGEYWFTPPYVAVLPSCTNSVVSQTFEYQTCPQIRHPILPQPVCSGWSSPLKRRRTQIIQCDWPPQPGCGSHSWVAANEGFSLKHMRQVETYHAKSTHYISFITVFSVCMIRHQLKSKTHLDHLWPVTLNNLLICPWSIFSYVLFNN